MADAVGDLADGESFVQADWREADVERVQFRRKQTDEAAADVPEDFDAQLAEKNQRIQELERERDELADRVDELESEVERLQVAADRIEQAERIETQLEQAREALGMDVEMPVATGADDGEVAQLRERIDDLEAENERLRAQTDAEVNEQLEGYEDFLSLESVQQEIEVAKAECGASKRYVKGVLAGIIAENGPVSYDSIAERLGVSTTSDVSKAASELERRKIVTKERGEDGMLVDLNTDGIEQVRKAAAEREKTEQLMEEI